MELYFAVCILFSACQFDFSLLLPCSFFDLPMVNDVIKNHVLMLQRLSGCLEWTFLIHFSFLFFLVVYSMFVLLYNHRKFQLYKICNNNCAVWLWITVFFPLWFCRISNAHMLAVSLCCWACCVSRQGH